jgi:hypothetical protein
VEDTTQLEPWEQQPGEPNLWYARYERYRLAGPRRSLLALFNSERREHGAKKARSIPQSWAQKAKQWRWRERAEAWDTFEFQQARVEHAEQFKEMNLRHIQEAKALQSLGVQYLKSLQPDTLSSVQALRFCIEAAKLERTAMGEPEIIVEQRLTGGDGAAVAFTLEDALQADLELEKWHHDQMQQQRCATLSQRDS